MDTIKDFSPKFAVGRTMITPGAREALETAVVTGQEELLRHMTGDWGDIDADDAEANETALLEMARLLSAYLLPGGARLWILTEADRSQTTLMLPDDY